MHRPSTIKHQTYIPGKARLRLLFHVSRTSTEFVLVVGATCYFFSFITVTVPGTGTWYGELGERRTRITNQNNSIWKQGARRVHCVCSTTRTKTNK